MPQKMAKKRNNGNGRRARRSRRNWLTMAAVGAFLFVCAAAFISIGLSNHLYRPEQAQEWIVDGDVEILAAPLNNTLERSSGSPEQTLPFLTAPTEAPAATVAPPAPTATPVPAVPSDESTGPETVPVVITAVGDCTLGGDIPSGYYRSFASYYDSYGADYFFSDVRDLFESDDLTIVNLEGPLTTSTEMREGRRFNFKGRPEYVDILTGSSVEIANVANNHAMDFGDSGFAETLRVLADAGIGASGFRQVYTTEVSGVTVTSIGFTEWAYEEDQIVRAVRAARAGCDLLIVSVHWGEESSHEATATQRRLGRAIVDAGADVVIGTHTHVYGGVERYNGKYIVYSLGNFCFGCNTNPGDKNCLLFRQTFLAGDDGSVSDGGAEIIPASVSSRTDTNDYHPVLLEGERAQRVLRGVRDVSDASTVLSLSRSGNAVTLS